MRVQPLLPKLLYFFFFGAIGLASPFAPIYLASLVPKSLVGWILGIMQLSSLLFGPFWGFIADLTARPRLVLVALMTVGLGGRWAGAFFLTATCPPWMAASVYVVSEMVFCGTIPVLDALVCRLLQPDEEFGQQRLFGAISWGVAAPLAGLMYEHIELKWGLLMAFVGSFSITGCLIWSALSKNTLSIAAAPLSSSTSSEVAKLPMWAALKAANLRWQQVAFFGVAPFAGFANSSIGTFLFLHLQDLNGSSDMMGLAVLMMIVSEIPLLYYSHRIVTKIGTFSCVLMGLIAYCIRMVWYQALGDVFNPWLVLVIEPAHGITFGIFYSACVSYVAKAVSNEQTRSTWQGVFTALLSVGKGAGSIGGGYLFASGGGRLLFRVGALIMLVASLLFAVVVATDRGFFDEAAQEVKEKGELLGQELEDVFSADEEEDEKFHISDD